MLIEIAQIIGIHYRTESFYWALLPSRQLIALSESAELTALIAKNPDFTQTFTVMKETVDIYRWKLQNQTTLAAPMNDMLLFSKLLIFERNHIYPYLSNFLEELKIPFKESWLFRNKEDFFCFLFSQMYESWKYSDSVTKEKEKQLFDKINEYWNFQFDLAEFMQWMNASESFFVKVVGEEYHLVKDELQQLQMGDSLQIMTDPLNDHDSKAVAIFTSDGKQIGFLRRTISDKLFSRLINQSVQAKIIYIDTNAIKNERIGIQLSFQ